MPEHVARFHAGNNAVKDMQIRAANGARGHLDDHVPGVLDNRVRNRIAADIVFTMET